MKLSPLVVRSLVLVGLSAMIVVLSVSGSGDSWEEYKKKYEKVYSPEEDKLRKQIFLAKVLKVEQFNKYESMKANYSLEINQFSDMTQEEFEQSLGFRDSPRGKNRNSIEFNPEARKFVNAMLTQEVDVPDYWDWRESRIPRVSPNVKDQFNCGSCWAMATVGLLEGQEAVLNDTIQEITDLSVQQLVDCTGHDNNCTAGRPWDAIDYVARRGGMMADEDYPYTGADTVCKDRKVSLAIRPQMIFLPEVNETALKKIVYLYGPVAVTYNAGRLEESMKHYKHSVWPGDDVCHDEKKAANHAVLIVGYGTHPSGGDYWLIKNSWGSRPHDKGYFRITRGRNTCRIAERPMIVMF